MHNPSRVQNKFAASDLRIFERAIEESHRRKQNYVSLGHLLIALDAEDGGSFGGHLGVCGQCMILKQN